MHFLTKVVIAIVSFNFCPLMVLERRLFPPAKPSVARRWPCGMAMVRLGALRGPKSELLASRRARWTKAAGRSNHALL